MTTKNTSHQMEQKLPELFGLLPKSPVTVEPTPDFANEPRPITCRDAESETSAGRVVVAVSNPTKRTLIDDEAITYHEATSGIHCKLVSQTWKNFTEVLNYTVFIPLTEGSALYSEQLGKEIGFYRDPVSGTGSLNLEMLRAVRLVGAVPGIHEKMRRASR